MNNKTITKKFFSTLSLADPNVHKEQRYTFDDSCSEMAHNELVRKGKQYHNPIMPVLRHNVEPGDTVKLYIIACIGYPAGDCDDRTIRWEHGTLPILDKKDENGNVIEEGYVTIHKNTYMKELREAGNDIGFDFDEPEIIYVEGTKNSNHLKLLQDIVSKVEDEDIIFMDITYGIRSIIISQFLALTYSYKVRRGVSIGMFSYGENFGPNDKPCIYNLNSFFLFNQTINNLGDLSDPEPLVNLILSNMIGGGDDDE